MALLNNVMTRLFLKWAGGGDVPGGERRWRRRKHRPDGVAIATAAVATVGSVLTRQALASLEEKTLGDVCSLGRKSFARSLKLFSFKQTDTVGSELWGLGFQSHYFTDKVSKHTCYLTRAASVFVSRLCSRCGWGCFGKKSGCPIFPPAHQKLTKEDSESQPTDGDCLCQGGSAVNQIRLSHKCLRFETRKIRAKSSLIHWKWQSGTETGRPAGRKQFKRNRQTGRIYWN